MSNNLERPTPTGTSQGKVTLLNESDGIIEAKITELLTKALDEDGSTTLADSEALRYGYFIFTGSLSNPENVIVPTNPGPYFCLDSTTGGQTVTVKTAAGTGIALSTSAWKHLLCDGTNVIEIA